ncbi:MAG TPA: hypothetical protein VKK79_22865, partial [Candidatus Lokiarchaeia archaeon]|nr:hypothetical protein [Candidatus Lokiarchaeia archaeon]
SLADIVTALDEKIVALERGLGIDPSMNDGWTKLGYVYTDPEQKKTAFQRAVGINPQDILAWKGVAGVLTSLPEQIFCYQRVLEVNPQDGDALNFLIQAGIPLEDIGVQLSEAGVGEKPAKPSESMPETEIPRNLPKPSYDLPESSSAEPEYEIPKNLPKPSYALPGKEPAPSATATEDDDKRVPVDASDLQVKEILEIVQEEHKLYFEEVAEKVGTPINNLKTFFKELLEEGKITGEFAVTGVSFNFDEGEQTLSLDNLKLAFATERGKARLRGKAASEKKDLEKIASSAPKEDLAVVDNYDTKRESKSVPYARLRYDREIGLAYIEGDKEQPYKASLNDTCPDCHKRIFEFEAFCRWCGSKIGEKVLVRSATGVTLPNSEAYPKEVLLKQGPVDEMDEPALNEYPAIIIIRAKGVKMKEFFNNMEMTVPGMLHYEDMKAKELQKFYKSNGWDAPKMVDFPEEKGVLWLLVVGKAIGKKDFEDAWGRYCEAVPGLKVLRIDFLNTDELKMHEWRAKYK